jgi:RNA-directed DNA polymerase
VQKAVAWVLSAVFEQDFLNCSHGLRTNRSPHTALYRLRQGILRNWARYVVEVDVVGFFDAVNWTWLRKFVRHRVNDGGMIRLLNKWLKAGVMENGLVTLSEGGVPQGGRSARCCRTSTFTMCWTCGSSGGSRRPAEATRN